MLTYEEAVEKIDNNETINSTQISGITLIKLFINLKIKSFNYYGDVYEMHFAPTTKLDESYEQLTEFNCGSFNNTVKKMCEWINCWKKKKTICIYFEDTTYNISFDILETK